MNLDSHFSLIFFLFFLTPGLYFDYLSKRHQNSKKESSLQELGRIVGSSLIVVIPGMTLSLIVSMPFKPKDFSYLEFLRIPSNLFNQYPLVALGILFLSSLFSLIFVLLLDNFLIAFKNPNFTDETIWNHFFSNQVPQKFIGWRYPFVGIFKKLIRVVRKIFRRPQDSEAILNVAALITTIDSSQFVGIVEMWSSDENIYGREVMLTRVSKNQFLYLPQSFKEIYLKDSDWARMTIPESNILSIKIIYLEMQGG